MCAAIALGMNKLASLTAAIVVVVSAVPFAFAQGKPTRAVSVSLDLHVASGADGPAEYRERMSIPLGDCLTGKVPTTAGTFVVMTGCYESQVDDAPELHITWSRPGKAGPVVGDARAVVPHTTPVTIQMNDDRDSSMVVTWLAEK